MNFRIAASALAATIAAGALFFGACRDNNSDDCPTTFLDKDGHPLTCTSTDLQCPYTVTINNCDNTTSSVASSCTCTQASASTADSVWVCASPGTLCPDAAVSSDGGDETSTDDASDAALGDDATSDAPGDDAMSDAISSSDAPDDVSLVSDALVDAPIDSPADALKDAKKD